MSFLTDRANLELAVVREFPNFNVALGNVTARTFRISDRDGSLAVQVDQVPIPLDGGFGMVVVVQNYRFNPQPTAFGQAVCRFIQNALIARYLPVWIDLHWEMGSEFVPPLVEGWTDLGGQNRPDRQSKLWIFGNRPWIPPTPPIKQEDALVGLVELAKRTVKQGVLKSHEVLEAAERGIILGMEELR